MVSLTKVFFAKEELDKYLNKKIELKELFFNSPNAALNAPQTEALNWQGEFKIDLEDRELFYDFNTWDTHLTYLSLDGHLEGQIVEDEDGGKYYLTKNDSFIFEALLYQSVSGLNVLNQRKLKALEYSLFPKYTNGYLTGEDDSVANFTKLFSEPLAEMGLLQKLEWELNYFDIFIISKEEVCDFLDIYSSDLLETISQLIKNHLNDNLTFVYQDLEYGDYLKKKDLNKLIILGSRYNPNLELIDLYE